MTQDKVGLRINFVCNYRITDYVKILTEIDDYAGQMRCSAARSSGLCRKQSWTTFWRIKTSCQGMPLSAFKAKENGFFVEIIDAGVKDIILPGEIRDIARIQC